MLFSRGKTDNARSRRSLPYRAGPPGRRRADERSGAEFRRHWNQRSLSVMVGKSELSLVLATRGEGGELRGRERQRFLRLSWTESTKEEDAADRRLTRGRPLVSSFLSLTLHSLSGRRVGTGVVQEREQARERERGACAWMHWEWMAWLGLSVRPSFLQVSLRRSVLRLHADISMRVKETKKRIALLSLDFAMVLLLLLLTCCFPVVDGIDACGVRPDLLHPAQPRRFDPEKKTESTLSCRRPLFVFLPTLSAHWLKERQRKKPFLLDADGAACGRLCSRPRGERREDEVGKIQSSARSKLPDSLSSYRPVWIFFLSS